MTMKPKFYFSEEEEKTISIDFDGVIHNDNLGWHDGTIYGDPIEGSLDAIKLLSTVNENYITSSKENFIRFLWQFHNKVNKTSGSKEIDFEIATAMYSRAITSLIINNFIDVMNIKSPDLKLTLIKTMSKNVYMPSFNDYINKNYKKFNY